MVSQHNYLAILHETASLILTSDSTFRSVSNNLSVFTTTQYVHSSLDEWLTVHVLGKCCSAHFFKYKDNFFQSSRRPCIHFSLWNNQRRFGKLSKSCSCALELCWWWRCSRAAEVIFKVQCHFKEQLLSTYTYFNCNFIVILVRNCNWEWLMCTFQI